MLQPYFGCIRRSPTVVDSRMRRLDSISSRSEIIRTRSGPPSNVGGKSQPVPRNENGTLSYPISTVGEPTAAPAPQMQVSLVRSAGRPPISTVVLPDGNALEVTWPVLAGITQTCESPATAAGMLPISTVETPGPMMVPPCVVVSVTRAAAAMYPPLS